MRLRPDSLQVFGAISSLCYQTLVELSCVRSSIEDFGGRSWLGSVLVRLTRNFMSRSLNVAVVTGPQVVRCRKADHRKRRHTWCLLAVAVNDLALRHGRKQCRILGMLCRRRFSLLCGTRSLLSGGIIFSKALLPCFGLPVIVSYAPPTHNEPTPELTKH